MTYPSPAQKAPRNTERTNDQLAPAGPLGIAMVPPVYGIDVVDRASGEAAPELGQAQQPVLSITQSVQNGLIQRKAAAAEVQQGQMTHPTAPASAPPIVHDVLRAPGQPLDSATRTFMEPRFGHDFSRVRIHADAKASESAQAVHALAYTVGRDIVFGAGQYSPDTNNGRALLVHELTHAIQQRGGSGAGLPLRLGLPRSNAEHEADKNAARSGGGAPLDVAAASELKVARKDGPKEAQPKKSYWFQDQPPEKKTESREGIEERPMHPQVVSHSKTLPISKEMGNLNIQFAGMDDDFSDNKPIGDMASAEQLVLDAINGVLNDLDKVPPIKGAPSRKVANEQVKHNKMVRARFKEAFSELAKQRLNIFIATKLTVNEKMSSAPLTLKTTQIYVNAEDLDDPSKLQAAIRIPLVTLLGGEAGLRPRGEEFEERSLRALKPEEIKMSMLHELVHALFINRGVSFNQIWERVGAGMVKGPELAKEACEKVMRRYLRAQEELFVHTHVGELYGEPYLKLSEVGMIKYDLFIMAVDAFLESHSTKADQIVTLDVKEKVAGKKKEKLDWLISFKYPKSVTVSESDLTLLEDILEKDPGS